MLVTVNVQVPVLDSVNGSSRNDPTHTFPKSPLSAMATAKVPTPTVAVTLVSKIGVFGSLLTIRIVPVCTPGVVGVKVIVKSTSPPGESVSGVVGSGCTANGPAAGRAN